MIEKLRPCPFCGSEAELHTDPEDEFWEVDCLNIDCILCKTRYYATKQEAIKAWNRRIGDD